MIKHCRNISTQNRIRTYLQNLKSILSQKHEKNFIFKKIENAFIFLNEKREMQKKWSTRKYSFDYSQIN